MSLFFTPGAWRDGREGTLANFSRTLAGGNAGKPPTLAILAGLAGAIVPTSPTAEKWMASDWQEYFDERAAIAEFDGEQSRQEAEAIAVACCLALWRDKHPVVGNPRDSCAHCGQAGDTVPFGGTWLHDGCWLDWNAERDAEALAALRGMGVVLGTQ